MSTRYVASASNPGVKQVVKLRNARTRRETKLFVVEGFRELRRALDAEIGIEQLWTCPDLYLGENEDELVERAGDQGAEIVETSVDAFKKIAYRDRPEGLLAVCAQFDTSLARIELGAQPLVLVVESIEKPGNLGTMLRAAAAASVDGMVVADPTTDVFNPNVVRSSIGTLFGVPLAVTTTDEAIAWIRSKGLKLCAATPHTTQACWDAPLDEPVAIAIGSEQYGLSMPWLEAADIDMRIPMPGESVDSLNAAASAAILLFEAVRQRAR